MKAEPLSLVDIWGQVPEHADMEGLLMAFLLKVLAQYHLGLLVPPAAALIDSALALRVDVRADKIIIERIE